MSSYIVDLYHCYWKINFLEVLNASLKNGSLTAGFRSQTKQFLKYKASQIYDLANDFADLLK